MSAQQIAEFMEKFRTLTHSLETELQGLRAREVELTHRMKELRSACDYGLKHGDFRALDDDWTPFPTTGDEVVLTQEQEDEWTPDFVVSAEESADYELSWYSAADRRARSQ